MTFSLANFIVAQYMTYYLISVFILIDQVYKVPFVFISVAMAYYVCNCRRCSQANSI